jgi:hypothetical protein
MYTHKNRMAERLDRQKKKRRERGNHLNRVLLL